MPTITRAEEYLERIVILETHILHIQESLDELRKDLKSLMWKVISVGGVAGAMGYMAAGLAQTLI